MSDADDLYPPIVEELLRRVVVLETLVARLLGHQHQVSYNPNSTVRPITTRPIGMGSTNQAYKP